MDNKLINRRHFVKSSVAGMAGFVRFPFTDKRHGKNREERKLIYRTLGKTGIRVPVIGMGVVAMKVIRGDWTKGEKPVNPRALLYV